MSTLYTIEALEAPPTLADAATRLGVAPLDLDASFGVVLIDPARHLYAVSARSDRTRALPDDAGVAGPFANPRIEGFGPPLGRTRGK